MHLGKKQISTLIYMAAIFVATLVFLNLVKSQRETAVLNQQYLQKLQAVKTQLLSDFQDEIKVTLIHQPETRTNKGLKEIRNLLQKIQKDPTNTALLDSMHSQKTNNTLNYSLKKGGLKTLRFCRAFNTLRKHSYLSAFIHLKKINQNPQEKT